MADPDFEDDFAELNYCYMMKNPNIQRQYAMCAGGAKKYRPECMLEALEMVCQFTADRLNILLNTGMLFNSKASRLKTQPNAQSSFFLLS